MTGDTDKNALWTPGAGLQVWVPESARATVYHCLLCHRKFPEEQRTRYERHVVRCSKRHEDQILEATEERDNNILLRPIDKERYAHGRQNPRRKLRRRKLAGVAGAK